MKFLNSLSLILFLQVSKVELPPTPTLDGVGAVIAFQVRALVYHIPNRATSTILSLQVQSKITSESILEIASSQTTRRNDMSIAFLISLRYSLRRGK
jgi:hypothetical protein